MPSKKKLGLPAKKSRAKRPAPTRIDVPAPEDEDELLDELDMRTERRNPSTADLAGPSKPKKSAKHKPSSATNDTDQKVTGPVLSAITNSLNQSTSDEEDPLAPHVNLRPDHPSGVSVGSRDVRGMASELSHQVARLLSQEPTPQLSLPPPAPIDFTRGALDRHDQPSEPKDKQITILQERLKLTQKQLTQLRSVVDAKEKIYEDLRNVRETEAEERAGKVESLAEAKLAASSKLIKAQSEEIKESHNIIKELNTKLSQVYSGEEEQSRQRLEEEKRELLEANDQLKTAADSQRRKRKEWEREAKRARFTAEEAVKNKLTEYEKEMETLRKMLSTETENSKALISQLSQVRASNGQSIQRNTGFGMNASSSGVSGRQGGVTNEMVEELKARLSLIGDFTGFEILSVAKDVRGNIYDCIVTDITGRGLALNFKLQVHQDESCSYYPSLDEERDRKTIELLPELLRQFVRFEKEGRAQFYCTFFEAFNHA